MLGTGYAQTSTEHGNKLDVQTAYLFTSLLRVRRTAMKRLMIKDISLTEELDRKTMEDVRGGRIPDKFYELLPYLYAIAGVVTIYYFESSTGYASGLLLIFAAGLVFLMRRDYRHGKVNKKG
jgi:hypothetical protein